MGARDARGPLDDATRRLIRIKAWDLAQDSVFTPADKRDIEQELTLDLLRRLAKYDARRGTRTAFVRRVVENRVKTLLEHRLAERRDPRRLAFSLDDALDPHSEGTLSREEVLDPGDLDPTWGSPAEDHDLRVDLGRAIYQLPLDLARLAMALEVESVTQISLRTGIPRGTLYDAIARIQAALKAAGLREYLGGVRRFRRPSGT
ncbi:MAG: RNA polymerase subunit sigma-24 [bacterium]